VIVRLRYGSAEPAATRFLVVNFLKENAFAAPPEVVPYPADQVLSGAMLEPHRRSWNESPMEMLGLVRIATKNVVPVSDNATGLWSVNLYLK
jgi:hypothetical protein